MKKFFTLILLLASVMMMQAKADNVSGTIATDSTWSLAGSPYVVTGTILVSDGATLSIDSGVVVRFQSNLGMEIRGALYAYKCIFTSDAATPAKGDWNEIRVGNAADADAGTAEFHGCLIEYGGHATKDDSYGMLLVERGTATLEDNCEVMRSNNAGIVTGLLGNVQLTNTVVSASDRPVVYNGPGSVELNGGNTLTGNSSDVMYINFTENTNFFQLDTNNIPYEFAREYTIGSGGTLQIDTGNVMLMKSYLRIRGGVLNAYYTTFTSASSPKAKGDWERIEVGYSADAGEANFWGSVIEYGGYSSSSINYAMVDVTRGTASFHDHCMIRNSNNMGLRVGLDGQVNLGNSTVTNNSWPILYSGAGSLIFNGTNDLTGNTHDAVHVRFRYLSKDFLLDTIDVPYYFYSSFTIYSGSTLEIASGNIIKTPSHFYVDGAMRAIAGEGEWIYFTTDEDDNLGGDTNDDGTASTPNSRDWGSIHFRSSSDDANSILKRCRITYGGSGNHGGVVTDNASPTIDSCEFANNYYGAEFVGLSFPNFRYNTIGSSDMVPIAMSFDADPVFENNSFSFSDNAYDAIGLLGGTLSENAVLKQRDVTGIPNVTYLMLGTLTIPVDYSLTINKGIVIKGYTSSHRFIVKGALVADGEDASNRIVITSAKDDNHGNPMDTNKDGTQSEPDPGNWGGIIFEATSSDTSRIQYCQLKYGQLPSQYYNGQYISGGTITTVNASPIIRNNILNNSRYGLYLYQASHPEVHDNEITNTQYTPIALSVSADPTFSGNSFLNTGWTALGIIGEKLGFDGTIKLRNVASYDSIAYVLLADLTINSGTYVDIDPGVVVKMNNNTDIFVDGGFKAMGTENDTIIFTSIHDDNYGNPGDTEDNGDATSPGRGNWGTIRYQATSDDAYDTLNYCMLLYGGSGSNGIVTFADAGGTISNTLLTDSYNYGLRCEGTSAPVCSTNVEIKNCRLDPIAMSLKSNPTFSFEGMKIKANGNGSNGIRILEGTLSSDATLIKRDVGGIYNIAYILDALEIASGATLTVNPGVVIKFMRYTSQIRVNGALVADGTPAEKIVFTSLMDDSKGGDTNDDGNASNPSRGNWWSIVFNESDLDTLNLLDNCLLNYGGSSAYGGNDRKSYGTLRFFNATAQIDSCRIEQSRSSALGIFGSANPVITNNEMHNILHTPVTMSMFASPVFSGNQVSNLGLTALGISPETYAMDATIPKRDFAGYTNMTYYLYNTCNINSGTILTIPDGVVFKNNGTDFFNINGALLIKGAETNPVVFTHERDDDYGNPKDTNEDGDDTSPPTSSNNFILDFADISNDTSTIRHAIFRYSRAGVNLRQASPKIKKSRFEDSQWGVILNGVSQPAIDTNTFENLRYAPMQISLVSYPSSTLENEIKGNTYKVIGVVDEELVQDVTLTQKTFAGIENIPYYFHGDYTIGTSVVLTIEPGVVMKFNDYSHLKVNRGLIAEGGPTADSTIIFTSIRDDSYGGDSNNDGNATTPGGSYQRTWDGINFDNQALDNLCRLEHCVIKYAGWYESEAAITTESASPTITYSNLSNNSNAVRAEGASDPVINYCDIYDNIYYGVNNVNKGFTIDATNNWWGSDNGPTHTSNPDGTGDAVSDEVNFTPYRGGTLNPAMGDVSMNGYIQAYDASLLLQQVATLITFLPEQEAVADVSDDGTITAYDASLVLQYVAGSLEAFPAELKTAGSHTTPVGAIGIEKIGEIPGEQITLALMAEKVRQVSAFELTLSYDTEHLSLADIQLADATSQMSLVHKTSDEQGKALIAMASADALENDGTILYLTFSLKNRVSSNLEISISRAMANEVTLDGYPQAYELEGTALKVDPAEQKQAFNVYPNPTHSLITMNYRVENIREQVQISLFDALGSKVADLFNEQQPQGEYRFSHNLKQETGVSKGIYYIRIIIGSQTRVAKIIVE
jgi:parallel beta-helix repeat protein